MNENINIAEILKDAPKGIKLWSPMLGDCYFEEYQERESTYPIRVRFTNHHKENDYRSLSIYGKEVEVDSAECVLFPSKENRDWSTFKAPWKHKHFEHGQKVLVPYHDGTTCKLRLTFYSHYDESIKLHVTTDAMCFLDEEVIAYEGNEDKLGKSIETK